MAAAASVNLRRGVLSGYKALIGTIQQTFRGDTAALAHGRAAARAAFLQNAFERDAAKVQQMIADIHEAREFLTANIAQAKLNDSGRYELKLDENHGDKLTNRIDVQDARNAAAGKDKKDGCCGGGCG